ncbi:MAG: DUF2510 domain-containing protein [Protaetiibacter sp.]
MTDQATRVVPAGWYEDPSDSGQVRWWNGIAWTDHTRARPGLDTADAESARLEASFASPAAERTGTRLRPTSTAESWIISFTPILLAAGLLTAIWAWLYLTPSLVTGIVALVVVYAAVVVLAVLDRRKLVRWGHAPLPIATVALTAPVYLLVRALRVPKSWGQLITWTLLMAGLFAAPAAAWFGGAVPGVQTAVRIQSEVRDALVGSGQASAVSCPPIADAITVGSIYSCDVTAPDGSHHVLWVSIDTDTGDYSYAFAID